MARILKVLFVLSLSAFAVACIMGNARIWSQDQGGGVLSLQGDENEAMKDANAKMSAHCGFNNWHIVRRETATVGQEDYSNTNTNYGETTRGRSRRSSTRGNAQTNQYSGSRDVYETRVHYRCGQPSLQQGTPPQQPQYPQQGQPNYPQAQPQGPTPINPGS